MEQTNIWTVGVWHTKEGCDQELVEAWQAFAEWSKANVPGASFAYLLQDAQDKNRFFTFGPWKDAAAVDAWRNTSEFQAFVLRVRELCDQFEPHNATLVGRVE